MTREDAIFFLNGLRSANNCDETIDMAIAALREEKRRAEGCPECNWIDPALAWTGEDKPVYCKRCGRNLHNPQQISDKTHIIPEQV